MKALVEAVAAAEVRPSATTGALEQTERRLTLENAVACALAGFADLANAAAKILRNIAAGLTRFAGALRVVSFP